MEDGTISGYPEEIAPQSTGTITIDPASESDGLYDEAKGGIVYVNKVENGGNRPLGYGFEFEITDTADVCVLVGYQFLVPVGGAYKFSGNPSQSSSNLGCTFTVTLIDN